MEGNGVNNMAVINPPNVIMTDIKNLSSTNVPQTTLDQGYSTFSTACTAAQLEAFAPNCISGVQTHATNHNLQPAVDQQWNLAYEHQFGANTTASIGYAGNKIDHLSDIYLYNQKQLTSTGQVVPGPYMTQLLAHGVGQARYNNSDGISRYNALQATVAQKGFHGLDYQMNYTWSKCMTNTLGYFGSYGDEEGIGESQTQATQNFFQNEYDPRADYGRCTTDVASYFGGYAVYALPFGRGQARRELRQHRRQPTDRWLGARGRHQSPHRFWNHALCRNVHGRLQPQLSLVPDRLLSTAPQLCFRRQHEYAPADCADRQQHWKGQP